MAVSFFLRPYTNLSMIIVSHIVAQRVRQIKTIAAKRHTSVSRLVTEQLQVEVIIAE